MFRSLIFVFFQIFFLQLNSAFAQKKIEVIGIEATYIGSKSQSSDDLKKEALKKAKVKALAKAGIKEHVKSTSSRRAETISASNSENISFNKIFTSSFSSEIQGQITGYEIIEEKPSWNEYNLPSYYVKIDATVIKYENDPDYNFSAVVEGLEPVYTYDEAHVKWVKNPTDGCAVKFNIRSTKDSYLTIFAAWEDEVALLFPRDDFEGRDGSFKFVSGQSHFFGELKNEFWFNSPDRKSTIHRLIFVFHKEERSFIEDPNMDNMLEWIYEIPRDLRYIDEQDFTIHNKMQ